MALAEYKRFLQTLGNDCPSDVRKVANLVLQHFDELHDLSTAQGKRVKQLIELAQAQWESISDCIQPSSTEEKMSNVAVHRLKTLTVGPFRGFARKEVFELDSDVVLLYGPNGTGKTSFCEALEFGLLGIVVDAESKRFKHQNEYLKNVSFDKYEQPTITAIDSNGSEILVMADEELYRFCFIEKNRIDNFSRIAAQIPSRQSELISTLFGLDSFYEFVRNFSSQIDEKYIDLHGEKTKRLEENKKPVEVLELTIKQKEEELDKLGSEEEALVKQYDERMSFSEMVVDLRGHGEKCGLINEIETHLQNQKYSKSNLTVADLESVAKSIREFRDKCSSLQRTLDEHRQQISFLQLYRCIAQVQLSSPDKCPACKTSLDLVSVDPYDNAKEGLENLEHLATLESEFAKMREKMTESLDRMAQLVTVCIEHSQHSDSLSGLRTASPSVEWWDNIIVLNSSDFTGYQLLESHVAKLEERDKIADSELVQREGVKKKLEILRDLDRKIEEFNARRKYLDQEINSAKEKIDKFQSENATLIEDSKSEALVVARNNAIARSYSYFVEKLKNYSDQLPSKLIENLSERVVELYNSMNRHDPQSEKLSLVILPAKQNDRLKICYMNNENQSFDALHVLSEGHIRCLGLAILLAKNLMENCPFLVFDDPVNAIDDDHRASIRQTIFQDEYFRDKQVILTCHGEEFFKDIQNSFSRKKANEIKKYAFLPRDNDRQIRVDHYCRSRNYLVAARSHLSMGEVRDALSKARQALESLAKSSVWQYVAKHGDPNLSLKMRSSGSPIELRNLLEQLRSKVDQVSEAEPRRSTLLIHIKGLLGVDGLSSEWRYLNKGVHEEDNRPEFERSMVERIVSCLEGIDDTLNT